MLDRIIILTVLFLFIIGFGFFIGYVIKHYRNGNRSALKPTKQQIFDFLILMLRWYLAYYMFTYGCSKLTSGQFVRSEEILNMPLKDIDKFNLAWYLFSLDKTFNIVVGLSQIIGAILIVNKKTVLVGALMLLPVLGQIFLVDVAFTGEMFGAALPIRLSGMILSAILILYYYRDRMILVWNNLTKGISTKFKYKWWVFILLPFLGFITDFLIAIITSPIKLLINYITK